MLYKEFLSLSLCGEPEASVSLCMERETREKGEEKGKRKINEWKLSDCSPFNNCKEKKWSLKISFKRKAI